MLVTGRNVSVEVSFPFVLINNVLLQYTISDIFSQSKVYLHEINLLERKDCLQKLLLWPPFELNNSINI